VSRRRARQLAAPAPREPTPDEIYDEGRAGEGDVYRPRGPPDDNEEAPLFIPIPVGRDSPSQSLWDLRRATIALRQGRLGNGLEEWLRGTATSDGPRVEVFTAAELEDAGRWPAEVAATAEKDNPDWVYAEDTEGDAGIYINTALCTDGILGMLVNLHCTLTMGRGFRLELEPVEPPEPGKSPRDGIGAEERDVEACLNAAARHLGGVFGGASYPSLQEAVERLNKITMVHNRGAIILHDRGPVPPFRWKGRSISGVPRALEVVHPSDMGMVALNAHRAPVRVWRNGMRTGTGSMIDLSRAIYLWNAVDGAHVKNSEGFGVPPVTPAIPAARIVDKLDNEDFPTAFRISWTGVPLIVYAMPGARSPRRADVLAAMARNFVAGGPMVLAAEPDSVKVEDLKMAPQIDAMNSSREMYIAYCAHAIGLPSMAVTESGTGRATSTARSTMSTHGTIEPRRRLLGRLIAAQFGQPILEKNWKEIAKRWRVRVVFDPYVTESVAQLVEAANGFMASWPVDAQGYFDFIGHPELAAHLHKERVKNVMEAEKNAGMNDRAAQGGVMGKGKSGSSKKQNVSKPDEQDKR